MKNKGIALILVISILTVMAITVVSFIFTMRLESRAAANYLWQVKAGYVAEAGFTHALAVLKEDKQNDFLDTYEDTWRSEFSGNNIDNNDDGTGDSRWIEVTAGEEVIGRYAVLVEDEAAKININTAGFHNESTLKATQGAGPFEVSLKDFLLAKNISSAQNVAEGIIEYRYGDDRAPGEDNQDDNQNLVFLLYDGIDNDADGEIDESGEGTDEPQEFSVLYPFGDDRVFLATEEVNRVPEVSASIYNKIKSMITAYSRTASTDRNRELQWDINSIDAQQLLDAFLRSGVSDPWQKAVNLVDFADSDFAQSVVAKSSLPLYTQDQGPNGDWTWEAAHYESKTYGGIKGIWTWTGLTPGEYFLFLHAMSPNQYIGDVTLGELTQTHMLSGETFKIFPSGTVTISGAGEGAGSLTLVIQNNETLGITCYFKDIELVSAEGRVLGATEEARGSEGIRINEIMPQPTIEMATTSGQSPGGDWVWDGDHYKNAVGAGGPSGQGTWIWRDIPDGEYYLTVFAPSSAQTVGDVLADGTFQDGMRSAERFTEHETVTVSGGIFRIDIQNNSTADNCYFKSATLSQQPDGEYIELVNLTPKRGWLDGWSLEVTGTDGWPASIPLGTSIDAGGYLILAVDKQDLCSGINGNSISFENVWGRLTAAQLDFTRSLTSYSDMIDDAPTGGVGTITLRDASGNIVDIQEYSSSQVQAYVSLEKGDPTRTGSGSNIWFASQDLSRATPAKKNNNSEIIEVSGEETIEHNLDEVEIGNSPLANLGEIVRVSQGAAWKKIEAKDLMALTDKLTAYSLRLEAEGHDEEGGWSESLRSAPNTAWFTSETAGETGRWLWDEQDRIPNGVYTLYLYGEKDQAFSVSLHLADDSWTPFTPPITPGANKGISFGRIEIGTENPGSLPAHQLEMRLKNVSANNIAHFDYIYLAPLPYVAGKININTASIEVLQALPLIDKETAQRIIQYRSYGNKEEKGRGIGDILSEESERIGPIVYIRHILDEKYAERMAKFGAISNLITVRSDTYQVIATGQALRNGQVMAEKRIRAVIER